MTEYQGKYVSMGTTGVKVSRLAFGCGFRGIYEVNDAAEAITKAIDSGINFIDCANIYKLRSRRHAEEALGIALKGRRDKVVITSKFGAQIDEANPEINGGGASRLNMIRAVEGSLRRLQTDYIDFYLLHMPDEKAAFEETMRAFEQLVRDGKIRYAGVCNHRAWQVTAMQETAKRYGSAPISVVQNSYNLLNRQLEEEMFPATQYEGIGVMTYSPLAAGLLSGSFAHGQTPPEKSTWSYDPIYAEYLREVFPGRISAITDAVADIAAKYGVSSATVATAWVLQNKSVTSVVTGADTYAEFEDSLRAFTLELDAEDLEQLDMMSAGMREVFTHFDVQDKIKAIHFARKKA